MPKANQWKGQYGRAIQAVDHSVSTGLNYKEVAELFKVNSKSMCISANSRGLALPGMRPNKNYGKVKQAVVEAYDLGITYAETARRYGHNLQSLYRAAAYLNLTLKKKLPERANASIAQPVEQPPCKRQAVGSSPSAGSILKTL